MNVNIRKLGPADEVAAREFVKSFQLGGVTPVHLRGLLADPANMLLVAECDGETVGFVWAHWLDRLRRERQHLFLYEIEVDGRRRRQGVGRSLMNAVLREATSRKADVFVFTNHSNTGAVSFYEALGGKVKSGDDLLFVYPCGDAT